MLPATVGCLMTSLTGKRKKTPDAIEKNEMVERDGLERILARMLEEAKRDDRTVNLKESSSRRKFQDFATKRKRLPRQSLRV